MPTYRVRYLKHRARCRCFVSAHDVFELYVAAIALLCTKDWSANDGRVLVFWEVLGQYRELPNGACICELSRRAYLSCIANLQETGTAVEDLIQCQQCYCWRMASHHTNWSFAHHQ